MTTQFYHESGKGDHARVRDVSAEEYSNNWDRIFGKKDKLAIFNESKVSNFKASTALEKENSRCSTESEESSQEDVPVGE